ncbi:hypothetical protein GETHPA_20800 [Geothrix rubra]|uniref:Uncharacterized protein n=1 Tax=Geothrix rubra TaxID=2927977 RepID=A0ABQ5Q7H6_9BACT|nr:M4 family metallopeptidase [Geothrix rubra]GLH70547.1 hypothetical protein GETHPA_20800 [Geothrix rubra]
MATTRGRLALSYLAATLAAGALCAGANPQESLRVTTAASRLLAQRPQLGLDADNDFHLGRAHTDSLGQTHGHFQQMYKGVRVWGGDVITHTDREGNPLPSTNALKRNIHLNVLPSLGTDEILAIVHQDLNPKGDYATAPTTELVVYPETVTVARPGRRSLDGEVNAEDVTRQVLRYTLAYHVHTALENGVEETAHTDYLVNAHTGAILKKWNTLHTSAAVGTGNSQYSGTVQINTNSTASGYELRDMTRGTGGTFGNNVVTDLAHATSGNGTIYTNSTNTWGDGANYNGGSTTSANGQTAAVDAAYGIQATWDMYKNVLGRNGIDNTGKASYLRVHYSTSYDNAFWDDTCFCMTFGDGSQFKSLESVDVAGHEMSHGVCATSVPGGLTYSGESGGLNESNSDIFGTMVEFYDLGGGEAANATTIPATGGNWTIGEQLETASFPTPLRYMYKPSKDGTSPDAWSSTIGSLDVHYSSGPGNREFYFLSQGASGTSTSDYYSSYTPAGFAGVGNDHAARIHYRALTTYYTSNETYADARTAHINAAKDLYGAGSPEEQAVWNSFAAINVGSAWSSTPPPPSSTFTETEPNNSVSAANVVARTYTAIQGNLSTTGDTDFFALTMNPGETLAVAMTGPSGVDWDLKLVDAAGTQLAISQGNTANENLSYTNSGSTTKTVYVNPYIYSGTSATPYNLALTYSGGSTPPPADTQAPTVSATESGTSGTVTFNATATDNVGVTKVEFYVDNVLKGTDTASPYTMTLDSTTLANGSHTLVAKAYDAAGNVGTSTSVSFSVSNTTPPPSSDLVTNGGFESGATGWSGTTGDIGTFSGEAAHTGTKNCWLLGNGSTATETIAQSVSIPSTATSATFSFWLHIDTAETTTTTAYDTLKVQVRNAAGTVLGTLATYSNLNKGTGYTQKSFDLSAYKGQTVQLYFLGSEDSSLQTSFVLDDVSVKVQ